MHDARETSKSSRVSRNISNKLDLNRLLEKDELFRQMYLNNEISGIEAYAKILKKKQRQEENGFITVNGESFANINREIVNDVTNKKLDQLKTKEKILVQMMNDTEQNKLKLV